MNKQKKALSTYGCDIWVVKEKLSVNWTSFRSSCLRTRLSLHTLQLFQIVRQNIIGFWTCLPHEEY